MAGKKSASFTKDGIAHLAKNKPVVYEIADKKDSLLYIGIAKRGRVEQRLQEHLPGGPDPVPGGRKVKIAQKDSIDSARKSEARAIRGKQPPKNKQGK